MGLIFLYLIDSVQHVEMRLPNQYENMIAMKVLEHIEQHYRNNAHGAVPGAASAHACSEQDDKKNTGFNFKELLQRRRLNKAVELMCDTGSADQRYHCRGGI